VSRRHARRYSPDLPCRGAGCRTAAHRPHVKPVGASRRPPTCGPKDNARFPGSTRMALPTRLARSPLDAPPRDPRMAPPRRCRRPRLVPPDPAGPPTPQSVTRHGPSASSPNSASRCGSSSQGPTRRCCLHSPPRNAPKQPGHRFPCPEDTCRPCRVMSDDRCNRRLRLWSFSVAGMREGSTLGETRPRQAVLARWLSVRAAS
jgi:hypothetical protein